MDKNSKIYIAGHRGLVGSALMRRLQAQGYARILSAGKAELDLKNQAAVEKFFTAEKPEYVFLAAAKVGGILANSSHQADFIYENLMISTNVISAAWKHGVRKLVNLGSSCIYPKMAPQPLKESSLLSGPLEPTNEAYAVAKIAAIKLCRYLNEQYRTNFISVMPTNLYGPCDNFDLDTSHVLPALIRKIGDAAVNGTPSVEIWGDGTALREFLYVEDLAEALQYLGERYDCQDTGEIINIGTGTDISIRDLATLIARVTGYRGEFRFDASRPNGTPRKLLDVSRLTALGWKARTDLETGIRKTYAWYREHAAGGPT
jgi:GDP-L-fucose synthase